MEKWQKWLIKQMIAVSIALIIFYILFSYFSSFLPYITNFYYSQNYSKLPFSESTDNGMLVECYSLRNFNVFIKGDKLICNVSLSKKITNINLSAINYLITHIVYYPKEYNESMQINLEEQPDYYKLSNIPITLNEEGIGHFTFEFCKQQNNTCISNEIMSYNFNALTLSFSDVIKTSSDEVQGKFSNLISILLAILPSAFLAIELYKIISGLHIE